LLTLLSALHCRRAAVKEYIAVSPPFGGITNIIAGLSSGAVKGNIPLSLEKLLTIPSPYDQFITREDLMWYATRNLASMAMLAPNFGSGCWLPK
jgi:hypothetical protein